MLIPLLLLLISCTIAVLDTFIKKLYGLSLLFGKYSQRKTPDKIGQSAHRSAKNEVRDKIKIFTDFG